jgi:hypothetical protein
LNFKNADPDGISSLDFAIILIFPVSLSVSTILCHPVLLTDKTLTGIP